MGRLRNVIIFISLYFVNIYDAAYVAIPKRKKNNKLYIRCRSFAHYSEFGLHPFDTSERQRLRQLNINRSTSYDCDMTFGDTSARVSKISVSIRLSSMCCVVRKWVTCDFIIYGINTSGNYGSNQHTSRHQEINNIDLCWPFTQNHIKSSVKFLHWQNKTTSKFPRQIKIGHDEPPRFMVVQ